MRIGTARADITPARPLPIAGMMMVRLGEYVQSPLMVNAVCFGSDDRHIVLCSCDVLLLPDEFVRRVQAECAAQHSVEANSVIIACTHTHQAPCTVDFFPGRVCGEFMDSLCGALVEVVGQAIDDLEEADVLADEGWLDEMGFNRRGMDANGRAEMNYGSWNDDYAGLEGPRDGAVTVIWARDRRGRVKVVVPCFATHPTAALGSFYGADIVGAVREFVGRGFDNDLVVVYLTGAGGNTAQKRLDENAAMQFPWRGIEGIGRAGHYLGGEIVRVITESSAAPMPDWLDIAQTTIAVPIRTWPATFDPETLEPGFREYYREMKQRWPGIIATDSPVDVRLNVIRIGDAVICTNPGELYVEHGLAIKKGMPARLALIAELTDGYVGYLPTEEAFAHGGYSTLPALSSKLAVDAGRIIVDSTLKLATQLF